MAKVPAEYTAMYQSIFADCRCVRLTVQQAAQYAGCSPKTVTKRYHGWSKAAKGKQIMLHTFVAQLCEEGA